MITRRQKRFIIGAVFSALAIVFVTDRALAACNDPPTPDVDWRRCYQDNRKFGTVDLTGASLRDAFLARSDLSGANLTSVDGRRAKFTDSVLVDSTWTNARLIGADFTKSQLKGASFRHADLRRTRFFRADLRDVDFTGARLNGTDFLKANLSGATWTDGKKICSEGSDGQCN